MDLFLTILDMALVLVSEFFMIAATILFLKCFYDPAFQWNKKKAWVVGIYCISEFAVLFIPIDSALLLLLPLITQVIVAVYDYQGKRIKGVLRYCWVYFVIMMCTAMISDIGTLYVFPNYYEDFSHLQMLTVTGLYILFFALIYFYLYYRIHKKGIVLRFEKREKIFAAVYTVACIAMEYVTAFHSRDSSVSLSALGSVFILAATLIPVFFYYLRISQHFQERTTHQESHMQQQLAYFRQYKLAQEETRRFRHDIKNDLMCIRDLLSVQKTQEATQYLENLLDFADTLGSKYVSGDEILDSILASKDPILIQEGIAFTLDGVLAGGLNWKPMDICSVFANALDNAVEACLQLPREDCYIRMRIKLTPQFFFITLENPVNKPVDTEKLFKKRGGYTTKDDASRHGIGTYSIKQTVERYGGMVTAKCADKRFTLEFMIPR